MTWFWFCFYERGVTLMVYSRTVYSWFLMLIRRSSIQNSGIYSKASPLFRRNETGIASRVMWWINNGSIWPFSPNFYFLVSIEIIWSEKYRIEKEKRNDWDVLLFTINVFIFFCHLRFFWQSLVTMGYVIQFNFFHKKSDIMLIRHVIRSPNWC